MSKPLASAKDFGTWKPHVWQQNVARLNRLRDQRGRGVIARLAKGFTTVNDSKKIVTYLGVSVQYIVVRG